MNFWGPDYRRHWPSPDLCSATFCSLWIVKLWTRATFTVRQLEGEQRWVEPGSLSVWVHHCGPGRMSPPNCHQDLPSLEWLPPEPTGTVRDPSPRGAAGPPGQLLQYVPMPSQCRHTQLVQLTVDYCKAESTLIRPGDIGQGHPGFSYILSELSEVRDSVISTFRTPQILHSESWTWELLPKAHCWFR